MLKSNDLIITATPLDEAISQIIDKMLPVIEAKIKQAMSHEATDKLISGAEACTLFQPKISMPTLIKWVSDEKIKSYRIGGRVWYKASEIIEAAREVRKYKKG